MSDTPLLAPAPVLLSTPLDGVKAGQLPEQLRTLAAQFESMLLTQMLNSMRSSMFGDDESADSGFAKGPLADALYGELSLALSRSGGVGLGEMMMAPLVKQAGLETLPISTDEAAGTAALDLEAPAASGVPSAPAMASFLAAKVTSGYGWRRDPIDGTSRLHRGTDIALPIGHEVPAAQAGDIAFVGEQSGYGLTVVIDHGNGLATRYAHLSAAIVKPGDAVAGGQVIARSGASGRATGPHLHFELLEHGQPVDPAGRPGHFGPAIQGLDSRLQK